MASQLKVQARPFAVYGGRSRYPRSSRPPASSGWAGQPPQQSRRPGTYGATRQTYGATGSYSPYATQSQTYGARYPSYQTGSPTYGTRSSYQTGYSTYGTGYPTYGPRYSTYGTGYPTYGTGYPTYGAGYPPSRLGYQTYGASYPYGLGDRRGWPRRGPWWRYQGGYYGYDTYGDGSQDASQAVSWAQACLAQIVGPSVPQTGTMGRATRRAIRIFQAQQQLPPTGVLDSNTIAALQSACGGQAGPQPAIAAAPPPMVVPEPPPPVAMPEPPPPDIAPPPDAGPPPDAAPPPDAGDSEFAIEETSEAEQEFLVDGPCRVEVERHDAVPLSRDAEFQWAPDVPAVYIVYISGRPWYVGIAPHSLHRRLQSLAKTLRNFDIPFSALANRSMSWLSLRAGAVPRCAIQRRDPHDATADFRPAGAKHAILRILRQHFVKEFQTANKGNRQTEGVQFSPKGSLVVFDKGAQTINLAPGTRI